MHKKDSQLFYIKVFITLSFRFKFQYQFIKANDNVPNQQEQNSLLQQNYTLD